MRIVYPAIPATIAHTESLGLMSSWLIVLDASLSVDPMEKLSGSKNTGIIAINSKDTALQTMIWILVYLATSAGILESLFNKKWIVKWLLKEIKPISNL